MKKIYTLFTAVLLLLAIHAKANISITVTGATNTTPNLQPTYTSLALALTDLNAVTAMTGPVTFTLGAGTSETAPPTGLTIGSATLNAVLSATNTVTFVKAGGVVILHGGVGTATPSSASPDGILKLTGADYITIDGLDFADNNTSNPATMEFGVGLFKLSATDGCQNNTIKNCRFTMQHVNFANGSGPMLDGSVGIEVVNATATAATTALTPTAASGTNSNNKIYSIIMNGGSYAIGFNGYAATAGVGPAPDATTFLGDLNNDIGGSSAATGNTLRNFGGGGSNPAAGIRMNNQWSANISYNDIDNNYFNGTNHPTTLRGIYAQAGTGGNVTISNNTIAVKSNALSSSIAAIENGIGATGTGNTVTITGNTIQGSTCSAMTSTFNAIFNSATATTVNINSNLIQNNTYAGSSTTGTFACIYNSAVNTTTNTNNNQILNNSIGTSGSGNACIFYGIWSSGASTTINATGNTITGNKLLSSFGSIYAFRANASSGSPAQVTFDGNTVSGLTIPNSTGATASVMYGYYDGATPVNETVTNNTFANLSITGTSTSTVNTIYGIYNLTAAGTKNFSGNNINNLNFTGDPAGMAAIAGINNAYGTTTTIAKNVIHSCSATGTASSVTGILLGSSTATVNISNNVIGNLTTPGSTGLYLAGINTGSATMANLYFNTVYLNGTSTGTGFASACVYQSGAGPTVALNNNLLVNLSTATGTGLTACYRRITNALAKYDATSNNNLFYAGTPSASSLLFFDGTNAVQTLTDYKTLVSPRESASVSETVSPTAGTYFVSTTGPTSGSSTTYLHLVGGLTTAAESGGAPVSGYTTDYDGTTRNTSTPDIGADEFNGAPTVTGVTPLSACVGNTVTITGKGFAGITGVKIGGVAVATYIVNSSTSISASLAAGNNGTAAVSNAGTGTGSNTVATYQVPTITGTSIACNQITVNSPALTGPGSIQYSFNGGNSYGSSATSSTLAPDSDYGIVVRNSGMPACGTNTIAVGTSILNSTIALSAGTGTDNGSCSLTDGNDYVTIRDAAGKYIVDAKDNTNGTSLGNTPVTLTVDANAGTFLTGETYMRRHFVMTPAQTTNNQADLKLYFTQADVDNMATALSVSSATVLANLQVARFDGGAQTPASYTSVISITPSVVNYGNGIYSANFTTPGFSGFYPYYTLSSPLPVKLVSLGATNEGSRNKITWQSAVETDLATYQVQRSKDGISFETITEVPAAGKANTYSTYDATPVTGINYYRLRMIDSKGAATLSNTVSAVVKSADGFVLMAHPNPVSDVLTVEVTNAANNARIILTDVTGKAVSITAVDNGKTTIPMNSLAPGIYYIRYSDDNHTQTLKVSKQ